MDSPRFVPSASLLVWLVVLPGSFALAATESTAVEPVTLVLGQSVGGKPIEAQVFGDGDENVLILASIHGSEPAGTPLVEDLVAWLQKHPNALDGRRLVLVPIANPDGYAKRERLNANGVDLNRNFPAKNRTEIRKHGPKALSEPESAALMRAIRKYPPKRVLSIHQPFGCIDYDGPAKALAVAMERAIEGRLPVKRVGSRPGSLGSFVGVDLGVPIITLELPKRVEEQPKKLWPTYGAALTTFLIGK